MKSRLVFYIGITVITLSCSYLYMQMVVNAIATNQHMKEITVYE